jgi:predicted GIY-YIG superfamily endonuclease
MAHVYVLQLAGDRVREAYFYVGSTLSPTRRLDDHRHGRGAAWTRLHVPLEGAASVFPLAVGTTPERMRLDEDTKTKELMLAYGIDAVRGGSYCTPILSEDVVSELQRSLVHATNRCFRCGKEGHFITACPSRPAAAAAAPPPPRRSAPAKPPRRSAPAKPATKAGVKCYNCNRWGHTSPQCFKKRGKKK